MMKPLRSLKGVGDKTEKLFQKIGVITTEDLLEYFPRNYDAYEEPVTMAVFPRERLPLFLVRLFPAYM